MVNALIGALIGVSNLSKIYNGCATNSANFRLFLLAYTFGITSPNNRIRKVTTITSKINFINSESIAENKLALIKENKITTPILIKLLATRSVANNFLGFSTNNKMSFPLEESAFERSSRVLGDKEKKATSAPESNADIKSKTKIPIVPKSKLESMF
jgi:hypothetical protein